MLPLRPRPVWDLARAAADLAAPSRPGLRSLRRSASGTLAAGSAALILAAVLLLRWEMLSGAAAIQAILLYGFIAVLVTIGLPRHLPHRRFGPANTLTLLRAGLVCLLGGLIGWVAPDALGWMALALAGAALCLDGVDGWVARRTGSVSAFGSRFDMEVDGFFLLILCLLVVSLGKAGAWVLAAALPHYLFMAARVALPWLRRDLPPRFWRKSAFVAAAALLTLCLAPLMEPPMTPLAAALATASIAASFTRDLLWLHSRRRQPL